MKTLARFVIRPTDDGRGDLILGAMMKAQSASFLRPGVVYEIREILDMLTIKAVGETAIGVDARDSNIPYVHWSASADQILCYGSQFILTKDEYRKHCESTTEPKKDEP